MEKLGIPQVTVVSEQFVRVAQIVAQNLGMPDLNMVAVPHRLENASEQEIADVASKCVDEVARCLVSPPHKSAR